MSYEQYRELIEEVCEAAGITELPAENEVCHFMIAGVAFTLAHGIDGAESSVFSFCDFGQMPEENLAAIQRHLLEANTFLLSNKLPHFGVNPETGNVLLIAQTPLTGLTSEALLNKLSEHARDAHQWRTTYFLPVEEEENGEAIIAAAARQQAQPSA